MINIVTTFDGTPAKQNSCRKIKGEWYKKGEQCILIGEKWYRINSGLITKDWETGKWYLNGELPNTIDGIVGFNHLGIIRGRFTPNPRKNVLVHTGTSRLEDAISEDILPKCNLIDGIYYLTSMTEDRYPHEVVYGFHLPYRTKDIPKHIKRLYEPLVSTRSFLDKYGDYLLPLTHYTWGVEVETSSGRLPLKDCIANNLFPLRDGSIPGIEYTTPPMQSMNSFYTFKEALDRLKKTNHTINEQCSLHVHVGGVKESEIVALYSLLIRLEKNIYGMFPSAYIKTSIFKRRDYNNPMQRFGDTITLKAIFDYLSGGKVPYGFYDVHPRDPGNDHKWQIEQRYCLHNFIPFFFSENKTVEFRIHTPTMNFDKILLWMLFIQSILNWVRTRSGYPESLSAMVLDSYPNTIGRKLVRYLTLRKRWYSKPRRDKFGELEIKSDNKFHIDLL